MVRKMSRIKIELEKVLKERKISKNQLCYACKLQHTQLNNYCKNKVVRVDLGSGHDREDLRLCGMQYCGYTCVGEG